MITLELSPEEAEELHFIVDSYLSDLRLEIRETDNRDFRERLKQREVFVKKLLRELEESGTLPENARSA
jgi:hypothetical protein